jgi:hypothetical protein
MALFELPTNLPFSLGGLEYPADIRAQGTFVLPKRIPFTISALPAPEEIAYGSIGWEVVVRAHDDFESIILRTSDFIGLLFSDEEDSVGGGSVTFDLDDQLFSKNLLNGKPASELYSNENLWEAWFDGQLRGSWLGTNVKETQLQDSETRQVTIAGPGPAQVLEWAAVLPSKFPMVTPKLETLIDPITEELLDTTIWYASNVSVARGGGREEAQQQIDVYTQELTLLQADASSAENSENNAKNYYNQIVKSPSYTKKEKDDALKEYNAAKEKTKQAHAAVTAKQQALTRATTWRNLYATPVEPNTSPTLRIAINQGDDQRGLWSNRYDFVNSGISAWVDPIPQAVNSTGQATTQFVIRQDDVNYARIVTRLIGGRRRLVAEMVNAGLITSNDWEFDIRNEKYWRIRESQGEAIYETSADSTIWIERFRAAYEWDATSVQFKYMAKVEGNIGVNLPVAAFIGSINQSALPASEPLFTEFRRYLTQSQARGVIPYVTTTWSATEDSAGSAWNAMPSAEVSEGADLMKVLQSFATAQQASWRMRPDFTLDIRQKVWSPSEPDPTVQFHKEGRVVFHEVGSQLFRERTRTREDVANYIVGKNGAGQYAIIEDEDSMEKYQRREMFITAGTTTDLAATGSLIGATLETVKEEKNSWRIKVDADQPGRRVFTDYGVGDWIGIENPETGNIDAWKVVGIAISISADGETDLELTLQSRLELLAERLKAQIEKLGGSSNSAGISVGNPVTAATLIQQARLTSLLDVVLSDPADGGVLTYNKAGGFWTGVQPGDKTVPGKPEITDSYSTVYQSGEDVWTKAQIQISWTLPLNTDGSTITDGHHYELKYRPDTTAPYSATWLEAEQLTWNELHTWAQPTIPPISNAAWQTLYVGFDDNTTLIQELTPGVRYEFQIRAVDSSTPQHWSEWSDSVLVQAARDTIAPPVPAPPLVASSRLALQVTHSLGRLSGGEFNLPEDMDHFEVHVGGPEFYPTEETRVGKIPANLSMMRGRIPAIGTIQIENTEGVWVSVVAVDRTGNRSAGSPPVTASVNLIDDAHISDLTATKITAGTISSAIILAGIIQTAESGARAEMDSEGFRIYADDGDPTVSLVGAPGAQGNFLLIKDPEDSTRTVASIDGSGRGSFQNLYVTEDIVLGGDSLKYDIIDPLPKGVVALGSYAGGPILGGGPLIERGFMEISFIAEESRSYMVCASTEWESASSGDVLVMRLRDFTGSDIPKITSTWVQQAISVGGGANGNSVGVLTHAGQFTPGKHRLLLSFFSRVGNATVQAPGVSGVEATSLFWVEDIGIPLTDTMVINDAGVDAYNATGSPASPGAGSKTTYTKNYPATWSGSYQGNGAYSSKYAATMVQGYIGDDFLGSGRALVGFDDAQIRRDLEAADLKGCYITLYANHWQESNGGTARIGTHKYSSRPSSLNSSYISTQRVSSANWPKPGKRKVSLGTGIGAEFKSGVTRGVMVGPGNGSADQGGKFSGNGQSNEPVLTLVYVK